MATTLLIDLGLVWRCTRCLLTTSDSRRIGIHERETGHDAQISIGGLSQETSAMLQEVRDRYVPMHRVEKPDVPGEAVAGPLCGSCGYVRRKRAIFMYAGGPSGRVRPLCAVCAFKIYIRGLEDMADRL